LQPTTLRACRIGGSSAFVGNPGLRVHRFSRAAAEVEPVASVVMTASPSDLTRRSRISPAVAIALVLAIWLVYTAMQTISVLGILDDAEYALLGFIPGIAGVAVLVSAGLSPQDCHLRLRRPSTAGIAILVVILVFALSAVLPFGQFQGWNWMAALVLAPVAGVSQELFFRSSLLPAMQFILRGRPWRALFFHSTLFGIWHIAPLFLGAPLWAVFAVMLVPFICGIGWGWQVQRDRTIVWAMVQHSLIWVIGLQFPM